MSRSLSPFYHLTTTVWITNKKWFGQFGSSTAKMCCPLPILRLRWNKRERQLARVTCWRMRFFQVSLKKLTSRSNETANHRADFCLASNPSWTVGDRRIKWCLHARWRRRFSVRWRVWLISVRLASMADVWSQTPHLSTFRARSRSTRQTVFVSSCWNVVTTSLSISALSSQKHNWAIIWMPKANRGFFSVDFALKAELFLN